VREHTTVSKPPNLRWAYAVKGTDLPSRAKLVAYVVAVEYMNRQTLGDVRPGVPRLARDTSLSERTVAYALQDLEDAGYLVLVKRGGPGRASLYRGMFPHRHDETPDEAPTVVAFTCPSCGRDFAEVPVMILGKGGVAVCLECSRCS
jgi:hypothetical protein